MNLRTYLIESVAAVALFGAFAHGLSACTAAERSTATQVTSAVATVASSGPVTCAVINAVAAGTSTACGTVASDVGAVAALVETILKSLPAPAAMASGPQPYTKILVRGVEVTVPAWAAPQVQARLAQ